jgi:tetratricopeptide (TPR) repeat protein
MSSTGVLSAAAAAINFGDLEAAEKLLEPHLGRHENDVRGIELLAEIATCRGRYKVATNLLRRCLELAPGDPAPGQQLISVFLRAQRPREALLEVEQMLARDPSNNQLLHLKGAALAQSGDLDGAIAIYTRLLAENEGDAGAWLNYGLALKVLGRTNECVRAFRKATELQSDSGLAWWAIASMKTETLSDSDVRSLEAAIEQPGGSGLNHAQLHYTLGKAFEDRRAYDQSFAHYAEGARLKRVTLNYDPNGVEDHVRRSKAFFTPDLLRARAGASASARDPIFIVGLPRAGSTLLEQILASHSLIEGTRELSDLGRVAKLIGERKTRADVSKYPEILGTSSDDALRDLGESYLASTRSHRHTAKPMFTDKMPNNFLHIGLILLVLPNAKIIDARRNPMATCFSAFKQYFASGQAFSYDLVGLGRYYRAYLDLMAHFDRVAPGRIHRVIYEDMVSNTEAEVRSLLNYCGVAFEPACMRFFETDRIARTSSSEQVKQPIFASAVEHWRNYEPWLEPLKQALGSALDAHPDTPNDLS